MCVQGAGLPVVGQRGLRAPCTPCATGERRRLKFLQNIRKKPEWKWLDSVTQRVSVRVMGREFCEASCCVTPCAQGQAVVPFGEDSCAFQTNRVSGVMVALSECGIPSLSCSSTQELSGESQPSWNINDSALFQAPLPSLLSEEFLSDRAICIISLSA